MKNKANLMTLTDENFNYHVLENTLLVLVKFGTNWSGPCHIMLPIIEELAREYSSKVKFCKLDVEQFPETAKKFDVRTIPTLLFFKNGRVIDQAMGVTSKSELEEKLKALFPK